MILSAALLPLLAFAASAVHAQSIMRTPNLNVGSRVPSINPSGAADHPKHRGPPERKRQYRRTNAVGATGRPRDARIGVQSTLPLRGSRPTSNPACQNASRGPDGECFDRPVSAGGGKGGSAKNSARKGNGGAGKSNSQAAVNLRTVPNELVAEIDGTLSTAEADELARRHGLERIASENFPLLGGTIGLFRIIDRRPVETVRRELAADGSVRSVQLNFRYFLQDQKKAPTEGDAAQYAVAQLRLPQAHQLARGMNVTIAVIDSGVDAKHPELANSVADTFDALGSKEGPHVHGTGIAGAIVAHARLMGSAPEARLLAIRAFGAGSKGAESTSYVILRGLDYAAEHGAQIINMSFAGPKDPLIERGVAATAARGILMVAAAGNAGREIAAALSRRQSERDRSERHRRAGEAVYGVEPGQSHRHCGPRCGYLPAGAGREIPDHVRHLVFRRLHQRRRGAVAGAQSCIEAGRCSRDLDEDCPRSRPPGRDDLFGAGKADAFAAVTAAVAAPAVPLAAVSGKPAAENAPAFR